MFDKKREFHAIDEAFRNGTGLLSLGASTTHSCHVALIHQERKFKQKDIEKQIQALCTNYQHSSEQ